jgi:hypothetical protein
MIHKDDPQTKRLRIISRSTITTPRLAVGWFNRFGIHSMALDRGFAGGLRLPGVFVTLSDGHAL